MSQYPDNKTFCPYPWIHVMTQPTGTMSWCCVSRENIKDSSGRSMTVNKHDGSMSAAWNSDHMKEVRLQMIAGEEVKGCEHCYYLESVGSESYRTGYIRDWMNGKSAEEISQRIEFSKNNGGVVNEDPIYLDFRLGNLCNLKCRMCQPQNSSQIYKEQQKVIKLDPKFEDIVKPHSWGHLGEVIPEWWDSESFLEDTTKWLPGTKKMYFTGGEPTLIERNYWIMKKAIEFGVSEDMEIMFNTNCTNLRSDWKEILSHFNKITACLSIDAIGDALEYIRTGANWDTIKKNIQWYVDMPNVSCVQFSPVIMSLNIFAIKDLLLYIEEVQLTTQKPMWISYLICDYPVVMDLRAMPQQLRDKAIEEIKWLRDQPLKIFNIPQNKDGLTTILNILENKYLPESDKLWQEFITYMQTLDKYRNQNLYEIFPMLEVN